MASRLAQSRVSFIGGGNMAAAIIGGLLAKDILPQNIIVSEPWEVNREKMKALGVQTTTSNSEASANADITILAVKPQVAKVVCQELAAAWSQAGSLPLVISIAAGVTLESLTQWSRLSNGQTPHIVRVMPNTPALLGEGASGLYAGGDVTDEEKGLATALLASVSKVTEWVNKEELLDVVTGLSGKLNLSLQRDSILTAR
jgi:pyrroline-5-carboxylate reductase